MDGRVPALLERAGVRIVRTPVQAPNANAYAERFVRSVREECLDRLILLPENSSRAIVLRLARLIRY